MAGILLIIGLLSMYLYESYYWNYEDSVFQYEVEDKTYDLKNPTQRWDLPKDLTEISGLSFYSRNRLACIQDEDGILYIYDLKNERIVRKEQFGDKGDYEGVEIENGTAFILKSNGNVYHFQLKNQGIGDVEKIETHLTKQNDAEGLGIYKAMDELLVACKDEPGTKKVDLKKGRSIYRIDIVEKDFKKKPKYVIEGKAYNQMLESKGLSKKKHKPFKPSGVAVHPKNNYIFIIGTVGKMMVILNTDGEIEDLIPLDPQIFWQPEGICFSPAGDLFIASEGRGKKGYILKF